MGFNTPFSNVFSKVAAALTAKASLQTVILGEQARAPNLPAAFINPLPSPAKRSAQGVLEVTLTFSVVVTIRETEPANWFTDIIPVMCDVVDGILADRSLGGTVMDVWLSGFSPGEIKINNQLFFGGAVHFQATMLYYPGT